MAIEIIRICDTCKSEQQQIIEHGLKKVTYEVAYTCHDCVIDQVRNQMCDEMRVEDEKPLGTLGQREESAELRHIHDIVYSLPDGYPT